MKDKYDNMEVDSEIKEIISELYTKDGKSDINTSKLLQIFQQTELNFTDKYPATIGEIARLREIAQQKNHIKKNNPLKVLLTKQRVVIPAAAAFILSISFLISINFIKRPVQFGRVLTVKGNIEVVRQNKHFTLEKGQVIKKGDMLIAKAGSYSDMVFAKTVKFRILGNSTLSFKTLNNTDEKISFDVFLKKGGVLFNVVKLKTADSISIKTPVSEAVVRGTKFGVKINSDNKTLYEVYEGKIKVRKMVQNQDLDRAVIRDLNSYFKDNSTIVEENGTCSVTVNKDLFKKLTKENFKKNLRKISLPQVIKSSSDNLQMNKVMVSFLDQNDKFVNISTILIPKDEKTNPDMKQKNNVVSYKTWRKKNKSSYIIYEPTMKLLISINQNGIIETTDFKNVKWSRKIHGKVYSKPVIDKRNIYISSNSNIIVALSLKTGNIVWENEVFNSTKGRIYLTSDKNSIYAAATDGKLYRFKKSGKIMWVLNLEKGIETTPVLSKKLLFISLKGGRLLGIDKRFGLKVLRLNIESPVASMDINNDNLLIATSMGKVFYYSFKKDEVIWDHTFVNKTIRYVLFRKNAIYIFNKKGVIYKFNHEGEIEWNSDIGNIITKKPVSDKKNILIATNKAFYVIDKVNGAIKWSIVIPGIISKNVTVSKDYIYFVSSKKGITSLKKLDSL